MTLPNVLGDLLTGDHINAIFEFGGAYVCARSVVRLYKDKCVTGYNVSQSVFFTSWGVWNTIYYPSLDQWWSLAGGLALVTMNGSWSALALYYGGGFCALKTTLQSWSRKARHCLSLSKS